MCDYIESDSEMPQNFPLTYIVDQDYPHVSQDTSVNTQGRCLLDLCIGSRLRILNGRHEGDSSGKYTCYTPNGCSVVDYVIVSADIQHIISRFSLHPLTMYSDHIFTQVLFSLVSNLAPPRLRVLVLLKISSLDTFIMVLLFMAVLWIRGKHLTLLIMVLCFKRSLIVVCPLLLFGSCLVGIVLKQCVFVGINRCLILSLCLMV